MTASLGMALDDAGVDAVLVVRSVAGERGERARRPGRARGRPVSRHRHRGSSASTRRSGPCRHPLPMWSFLQDRRVLVPCFSISHSPAPAQLQARAVHQQVNGLGYAGPWPWDLQRLGPAAQGGMVGNREIETEQANDGADQAFGLAQSQTEHGLERQGRRDRQIRVVRLTARRGARLRVPGRDRRLREPDRQAPALAQGGIILGPVRDPALLLGI